MMNFTEKAKRYASSHNNQFSLYTHFIGIPLIVFSLIILFGFLHLVVPNVLDIKFADVAVLALLIYYFLLNWKIALVLTPIFIIMLWLAHLINYDGPTSFALWTFIITFLIGCGLQLLGHIIEGNRPVFWNNPLTSLLSPMFITAEIFFMAGKMDALKAKIYSEDSPEGIHVKKGNEVDL